MTRDQIQSSDTRSIVRSISRQCCATLLITLLDVLHNASQPTLCQSMDYVQDFFGHLSSLRGPILVEKKWRSDASLDKISGFCLSRGRIRTKSLRWGNPKVWTKSFERPKLESDLPTDNQGSSTIALSSLLCYR
jgi:hypothetical protein